MEKSSSSFEAFTRDLLGVGDGAESALRATCTSPGLHSAAPFFDSPFLSIPGAQGSDPFLDFHLPVGGASGGVTQLQSGGVRSQPLQDASARPAAVAAGPAIMPLQPDDVLMAPFMPEDEACMEEIGMLPDTPSAGSNGDAATEGSDPISSNMQLTVVREKNRIAQRKYRAKQRQRQNESSFKIADLSRKLAESEKKQAELQNREKLFERFIATQTLRLQPQNAGLHVCEGAMSAFRGDPSIKGIAAAALAHGASDSGNAGPGGCKENMPFSKIWASSATMKLAFGNGMTRVKLCSEVLTFTASGQRTVLTRDQVAQLTAAEYGSLWKDIINGLAGCLLQAKDDMNSPTGRRLLELIVEARNLKKTLGFLRPETLAEYAKQVATEHGPVPLELWRSIAGSLTLSSAQVQNCVLLRDAAFKHLGALMRQRSELAQSLTSFATLPSAETCGAAANDYLGSSAALAQLHTMLQEENGFTAQLMMNLYGRVFTPLQTAHVHVLAYPYECSALSLLDAIATGSGGAAVASASELLQQGIVSAEQSLPPLCEVISTPSIAESRIECCA